MENHTNDVFDRLKDELPTATLSDGNKITIPQSLRGGNPEQLETTGPPDDDNPHYHDGIERGDFAHIKLRPHGKSKLIENIFVSKMISGGRVTVPEFIRQRFDLESGDSVAVLQARPYQKSDESWTKVSKTITIPPQMIAWNGLRESDVVMLSISIIDSEDSAGFSGELMRVIDKRNRSSPRLKRFEIRTPEGVLKRQVGNRVKIMDIYSPSSNNERATVTGQNTVVIPKPLREKNGLEIGERVLIRNPEAKRTELYKNPGTQNQTPICRDSLKVPMHVDNYDNKLLTVVDTEESVPTATLNSANQITIPKAIRQGEPGDYINIEIKVEGRETESFTTELKANHRVTIPAHIRWALDLDGGEQLTIRRLTVRDDPAEQEPAKMSYKQAKKHAYCTLGELGRVNEV